MLFLWRELVRRLVQFQSSPPKPMVLTFDALQMFNINSLGLVVPVLITTVRRNLKMTRDEAKKILGEGATEEVITNFLDKYHLDESAKVKDLENKINNLTQENSKYSDYDEIKKQLDDINKANMSEQEKLEQMKKEVETNLKNSRIIVNTAKAKEILAGLDLDDDTIGLVVSDDETTTINRANNLKNKFDTMKENVAKQTKEELINVNLKPNISNVNQNDDSVMTLDKFMNLSADEQIKWQTEHPTEFQNL